MSYPTSSFPLLMYLLPASFTFMDPWDLCWADEKREDDDADQGSPLYGKIHIQILEA